MRILDISPPITERIAVWPGAEPLRARRTGPVLRGRLELTKR